MNTMNRFFSTTPFKGLIFLLTFTVCLQEVTSAQHSIARDWNEMNLQAIRRNGARPTVIARNLFHHSIAMYDAWAAYDEVAETYFLGKELGGYTCPFDGVPEPADVDAARHEAISFASYRILRHRYENPPGNDLSIPMFNEFMMTLGYDVDDMSTDYSDGVPAHLGNYIGEQIIQAGYADGANEQLGYLNQYYDEVNPPLEMEEGGNPDIVDMNRWQQLQMVSIWDQDCSTMFQFPQNFLSPEWGNVVPFSLHDSLKTTYTDDRGDWQVFMDPGPPALFTEEGVPGDEYRWNHEIVGVWSSHLDPDDETLWDTSPASIGNIQLDSMPETFEEYQEFFDFFDGGDASQGHDVNPATGMPYEPQIVKRSDYARILAEFWADGPDSEAPPGHWHAIYNEVTDYPAFTWKWVGVGEPLDHLEYDVKSYLTLGGAVHDAAIAAWSIKGYYDYIRPISALRGMADVYGQRTDPTLTESYHPLGLDLIPGFIEVIQEGDPLITEADTLITEGDTLIIEDTGYLLNEIKMMSWLGPGDAIPCEQSQDEGNPPVFPTDVAHVGWKPIGEWWPYQRPSFVTPPFAGYVSGHSTFSRAAAEVMTAITGDNYFPGGMGIFDCPADSFLVFEEGPSEFIELQWATYQDASDQCSLSRIWGGIHPPVDDIPGRRIGYRVGHFAFDHAQTYFDPVPPEVLSAFASDEVITDADAGTPLTFTVVYNEPMDADRTPTITMDVTPMGVELNAITWSNDSTMLVSFDVSDMGETVGAFSMTIDEAHDLAGNAQTTPATAYFYLDTENPTATLDDVMAMGTPISGYGFTFSFSESMADASVLLLETPVEDALANSLEFSSGQWSDLQTYVSTYQLLDADEELDLIDLRLSEATDSLGNAMVVEDLPDVFSIDTKEPSIVSVSPSLDVIDDEAVTNGAFTLDVIFDEEMDQTMVPGLSFDISLEATMNADPANSTWLDMTTYRHAFTLLDDGVELPVLTGAIDGTQDLYSNITNDYELTWPFSVDTRNPLVEMITANTYDVDNGDHGVGTFAILLNFDEEMDMSIDPIVDFPVEDPLAQSLVLNEAMSAWLSPQLYEMRYDVLDVTEVLEDIDVTASMATDLVGNIQVSFEEIDLFSIHLDEALSIFDLGGLPIGNVYPNPTRAGERITIDLTESVDELVIEVRDVSGRSVQREDLKNAGRSVSVELDELNEGMYLIVLESEGRRSLVKLQLGR